jgi:Domain of unknown function (DUF4157)
MPVAFMPAVQAKLRIGVATDKFEREAIRIADQVARARDPKPSAIDITESPPAIRKKCGQRTEGGLCCKCAEEEKVLQRKSLVSHITPLPRQERVRQHEDGGGRTSPARALSGEITALPPSVEAHIDNLSGSGRPLSQSARTFFEPRFGYDFGQVLIHTDAEARGLARALNARAFTIGQHIVFGAGCDAPARMEDRRLLAHELTHVIQQAGNSPSFSPDSQRRPLKMSADNYLQRVGFGEVKVAEGSLENEGGPTSSDLGLPPIDCSIHVSDVFKLKGTMVSERPECCSALIQDLRATNLLPETYRADYFLGNALECPFPAVADFDHWLGDMWNILNIQDRRVVVVNQCGNEEYLEMEAGAPQEPMAPPEEIEEPENPPYIDPSADPEKEFGQEVTEKWDVEVWGTKGLAIEYEDGTIQVFPEGGTGAETFRPVPGSIGMYNKYDVEGHRVPDMQLYIEPKEIFGKTEER